MSDFKDTTYKRVERIINYYNLNIKSFEEKVGVSNNSIGTAIRREASFKSNVLNKILLAFPKVNPTWLLTGRDNMLLDTGTDNTTNEPPLNYHPQGLNTKIKKNLIELLLKDNEVINTLSTQVNNIINQ